MGAGLQWTFDKQVITIEFQDSRLLKSGIPLVPQFLVPEVEESWGETGAVSRCRASEK